MLENFIAMRTEGNRSNLIAFPNLDSALFKGVMKFLVRFLDIFDFKFLLFLFSTKERCE